MKKSKANQMFRLIGKGLPPIFKVLFVILYLLPLYLLFIIAVKSPEEFVKTAYKLPQSISLENFTVAFEHSKYFLLLKNSVIITVLSILLLVVTATMAAYPISRNKGRYYNFMSFFFLAGLMVPIQMVMLPLYKIIASLGLMNTYFALILINVAGAIPFSIFFITGFLKTIPVEIDRAAYIDGATKMQTFWIVILPLIKPSVLTLVVLQSIFFWNDFMMPLVFLSSYERTTVMVGIYNFVGEWTTEWNYVFALITITILPVLALYFIFQKHIIEGIVAGAIKS